MTRRRFLALFLGGLLALSPVLQAAPAQPSGSDRYLRLRLVRIIDQHGFGQPMEAASILLPRDWKVEAGVRWSTEIGCTENMAQMSLRAASPDGRLGFEVFPNYAWKWSDDPSVLQAARQAMAAYGARGCDHLPPYDAAEYLQNVFLPRWRAGSTLLDLGQVPDLARARNLEYQAFLQGAPAPGAAQTEFDVALATLETARNGATDQEWILATVMRNALAMPAMSGMWGGYPAMANTYNLAAMSQFAARAPKGQLEKNERLFEAVYRSFRVNPAWDAAVAQVYQNIAAIERKGIRDRAAIISRSNREIGEIVRRTYENRQVSLDRSMERQSQALRGVDAYIDPATRTRVELATGYRGAWSNGLGDYILSDDPGFNPERALGGRWAPLQRDDR